TGSGIAFLSNLSTITIQLAPAQVNNAIARLSYTQNFPLGEAVPVQIGTLTTTGTTAASAAANPFGSSLSIQRIFLPVQMSLTEVDLAFGVSFPATNQGQGSIRQKPSQLPLVT